MFVFLYHKSLQLVVFIVMDSNILFELHINHDITKVIDSFDHKLCTTLQYNSETKNMSIVFLNSSQTFLAFVTLDNKCYFKNNNDFDISINLNDIHNMLYDNPKLTIKLYDLSVYCQINDVVPSVISRIIAEYAYEFGNMMIVKNNDIISMISYKKEVYSCSTINNDVYYKFNSKYLLMSFRRLNYDYVMIQCINHKFYICNYDLGSIITELFPITSCDYECTTGFWIRDINYIKNIYADYVTMYFKHDKPIFLRYTLNSNINVLIAMSSVG